MILLWWTDFNHASQHMGVTVLDINIYIAWREWYFTAYSIYRFFLASVKGDIAWTFSLKKTNTLMMYMRQQTLGIKSWRSNLFSVDFKFLSFLLLLLPLSHHSNRILSNFLKCTIMGCANNAGDAWEITWTKNYLKAINGPIETVVAVLDFVSKTLCSNYPEISAQILILDSVYHIGELPTLCYDSIMLAEHWIVLNWIELNYCSWLPLTLSLRR